MLIKKERCCHSSTIIFQTRRIIGDFLCILLSENTPVCKSSTSSEVCHMFRLEKGKRMKERKVFKINSMLLTIRMRKFSKVFYYKRISEIGFYTIQANPGYRCLYILLLCVYYSFMHKTVIVLP